MWIDCNLIWVLHLLQMFVLWHWGVPRANVRHEILRCAFITLIGHWTSFSWETLHGKVGITSLFMNIHSLICICHLGLHDCASVILDAAPFIRLWCPRNLPIYLDVELLPFDARWTDTINTRRVGVTKGRAATYAFGRWLLILHCLGCLADRQLRHERTVEPNNIILFPFIAGHLGVLPIILHIAAHVGHIDDSGDLFLLVCDLLHRARSFYFILLNGFAPLNSHWRVTSWSTFFPNVVLNHLGDVIE